jgi:hypothetical protein
VFVFGRKRDHDIISLGERERTPFRYRVPADTQAWVNGQPILRLGNDEGPEVRATVRLQRGHNRVLLRIVEVPAQSEVAGFISSVRNDGAGNYAAFVRTVPDSPDRFVPRLRWFAQDQGLLYDVAPGAAQRVGWYRFTAPPGLRLFSIPLHARSVKAWVDGESVPVVDGTVTLPIAKLGVSIVALRVEQEPGAYEGAAFDAPISLTCEEGLIPAGDWSQFGLATYSGIGVYTTEVQFSAAQIACRVILDLGHVKTVAEVSVNGRSAGVGLARPFRFDISELVTDGSNRIEVKVANTLANHMSSYPTKFIREGQTISGLIGPVEIRFLRSITAELSPAS